MTKATIDDEETRIGRILVGMLVVSQRALDEALDLREAGDLRKLTAILAVDEATIGKALEAQRQMREVDVRTGALAVVDEALERLKGQGTA